MPFCAPAPPERLREGRKLKNCRLICTDIDGTILTSDHRLTPFTAETLRAAEQAGIAVALVSARMPSGVRDIAHRIGLTGPIVCYGGGLILQGKKPLFSRALPLDAAESIWRCGKEHGLLVHLYEGDSWMAEQIESRTERESAVLGIRPAVCDFAQVFAGMRAEGRAPHKMLLMTPDDPARRFCSQLEKTPPEGCEIVASQRDYYEVMPRGVDKASALRALCGMLGISGGQSAALGDYTSDIPMLRAAGLGIAMGNAPRQVREAADRVADSNDADGAAKAIRAFILGAESGEALFDAQ